MIDVSESYNKISALNTFLRLCRSKAEVNTLIALIPDLTEYVRLPNGKEEQNTEAAPGVLSAE